MERQYDLIIIGAGPGGYTAALRASELGLKTALVEKDMLGGVCVNNGCVPAKALLQATSTYRRMLNSSRYGIHAENISFEMGRIQDYKDQSVLEFRELIRRKITASDVDLLCGAAVLHKDNVVEITDGDERYSIRGTNVILATGSHAILPDIPGIDLPQVMTSRNIMKAREWNYDCLVIIGGGVIGIELATVFASLQSRVTILESTPRLLPQMDPQISAQLMENLRERGVEVICGVRVTGIEDRGHDTVFVNYTEDGAGKQVPADRVLVSVGRRASFAKALGADCEVRTENGSIVLKSGYRTTQEGVYAIGDCVSFHKLAHVAASQGAYVVEKLAKKGHRIQLFVVPNGMYATLPVVPSCIYTDPEIASVGLTAEAAAKYNLKVKCGQALLKDNGRAILVGQETGCVILVFEAYTNTLIGAQLMCARATDMIGELSTAVANGLTAYQLETAMRAHPTYSESITEAIRDALGDQE